MEDAYNDDWLSRNYQKPHDIFSFIPEKNYLNYSLLNLEL